MELIYFVCLNHRVPFRDSARLATNTNFPLFIKVSFLRQGDPYTGNNCRAGSLHFNLVVSYAQQP